MTDKEQLKNPVIVHRVQGNSEANVVKSLLKTYDIACLLTSNIGQGEFPFTVNGLGEVRVVVSSEDEEKAKNIIAGHLESAE